MTIFVIWQFELIVTLDSIFNSCDVFFWCRVLEHMECLWSTVLWFSENIGCRLRKKMFLAFTNLANAAFYRRSRWTGSQSAADHRLIYHRFRQPGLPHHTFWKRYSTMICTQSTLYVISLAGNANAKHAAGGSRQNRRSRDLSDRDIGAAAAAGKEGRKEDLSNR